jgi:hypothetical protein
MEEFEIKILNKSLNMGAISIREYIDKQILKELMLDTSSLCPSKDLTKKSIVKIYYNWDVSILDLD